MARIDITKLSARYSLWLEMVRLICRCGIVQPNFFLVAGMSITPAAVVVGGGVLIIIVVYSSSSSFFFLLSSSTNNLLEVSSVFSP